MVFIPPVTPGHVDPESERYNAKQRIQQNSVWALALGGLWSLTQRAFRLLRRRRDPYGW